MWGLQLKPADYAAARPDPVAHFTAPIAKHMNEDHGEQLTSIVRHVVPLGGVIAKAIMTGLDRFGMDVQCTDDKDETFPCRVPFTRCARTPVLRTACCHEFCTVTSRVHKESCKKR